MLRQDYSEDEQDFDGGDFPESKSWAESLAESADEKGADKDLEILQAMLEGTKAATANAESRRKGFGNDDDEDGGGDDGDEDEDASAENIK